MLEEADKARNDRMPLTRMHLSGPDALMKTINTELLMTSVPPIDNISVAHVSGIFSGQMPLRTSVISKWPLSMPELQCLHCGGLCDAGPPIPAARLYEIQVDQYWVFGPFCRPCCAVGHICENDSTSKQLAPTVELLRRYFGVRDTIVAPPRCAHKRFGGPLSDVDFYGLSGFRVSHVVQPPFVTFANYVVGVHNESHPASTATALLPQSAGRLVGLERPKVRAVPLAFKKPSGSPPLYLEFLASVATTAPQDNAESIEVKSAKKRGRNEQTEAPNFLKQYVKKNIS